MKKSPLIVIVDDEPETLTLLQEIMAKEGYDVETVSGGKEAVALLDRIEPDVVLTDIQMPELDGITLLTHIQTHNSNVPVILLTAYGSLKTAVDGIKAGAYDYLSKPFVIEQIRLIVRRALEHKKLLEENRVLREQVQEVYGLDNIQGKSPVMVSIYKLIARAAPTESTILIQGESGTGKELVARAIHANSLRKKGPFVAVDCGTLTESLLESELFGHERGAFTGAVASKKGLLETAHQGTCFLDEIGDITPTLQSKLLRVLQEHEIRRVGGTGSTSVNVRMVAASNKDLKQLVESGKFREDLYYRINVVTITLPPLRERTEDIPLLVQHFLDKYGKAASKHNIKMSQPAMALLLQYPWPGNVRELEHCIERAIVLAPHSMIMPEDLPLSICSPSTPPSSTAKGWKTLQQLEREHIFRVLDSHQGNESLAAEILGIHRKTLQRKLKEYNQQPSPSTPQ